MTKGREDCDTEAVWIICVFLLFAIFDQENRENLPLNFVCVCVCVCGSHQKPRCGNLECCNGKQKVISSPLLWRDAHLRGVGCSKVRAKCSQLPQNNKVPVLFDDEKQTNKQTTRDMNE
jgi:hypothetical protein